MQINEGSLILLVSPDEKTFLLRVEKDKEFHTHQGILNLSDAIGKSFGDSIYSNLGKPFFLLDPTIEDKMMKVRRKTQIIYPKDAAIIAVKAGIHPGMRVIECGAGSGAFTILLAHAVMPTGIVYTYDRNPKFLENAKRNVLYAGCAEYVVFKERDVNDGFEESEVDVVILDLPFPWEGIACAGAALRGGGRLATVSPTINQVERTIEAMKDEGFMMIETLEVLVRNYRILTSRSRPYDRMVAHTAYITIGRKINELDNKEVEKDSVASE